MAGTLRNMGVYEADAIGIDDIAGGSAVHTTWFIFKLSLFRRAYARDDVAAVSYTHLTLPTIYSV